MNAWLPWIISLLSGAAGGNIAGRLLKNLSLGKVGDSIVGILGGGLGSYILSMLGIDTGTAGQLDVGSILGSIGGGAVGGGVLLSVIGAVKNALGSK